MVLTLPLIVAGVMHLTCCRRTREMDWVGIISGRRARAPRLLPC
jgi:hypothetical protein